jgi:hypothetical protein
LKMKLNPYVSVLIAELLSFSACPSPSLSACLVYAYGGKLHVTAVTECDPSPISASQLSDPQ